MSELMVEVKILSGIGDKDDQGVEIATLRVSDYKHPCSNAIDVFARLCNPRPGVYYAVAGEHYGRPDVCVVRFEIRRPEVVTISNGRTEIRGGDYGWSCRAYDPEPEIIKAPSERYRYNPPDGIAPLEEQGDDV